VAAARLLLVLITVNFITETNQERDSALCQLLQQAQLRAMPNRARVALRLKNHVTEIHACDSAIDWRRFQ